MTTIQPPIGILGGTFDPVHLGHLHIALCVLKQTLVNKVLFLPCYQPVHRLIPHASVQERIAMIQLAIKNVPNLSLDTHEIDRKGPSYMIDTLTSLRTDYPYTPLSLILGIDVYQNITSWKRYQALLDYAHLLIINRRDFIFKQHPNSWLQKHETDQLGDLTTSLAGRILFLDISACDISATLIRQRIKDHKDISDLVPLNVAEYIRVHQLYL